MLSTHQTGWPTSRTESAEPKVFGKQLSFEVAGTKPVEYCAQHTLMMIGSGLSQRNSRVIVGSSLL